jgi:hypothetical protein
LVHLTRQATLTAQEFGMRSIADLLRIDIDKVSFVPKMKLDAPADQYVSPSIANYSDTRIENREAYSLAAFLVVYDGKIRRYLPVLTCQLVDAKRLGYELITGSKMKYIDPKKAQDDISWASSNFEKLDVAVRGLIVLVPSLSPSP